MKWSFVGEVAWTRLKIREWLEIEKQQNVGCVPGDSATSNSLLPYTSGQRESIKSLFSTGATATFAQDKEEWQRLQFWRQSFDYWRALVSLDEISYSDWPQMTRLLRSSLFDCCMIAYPTLHFCMWSQSLLAHCSALPLPSAMLPIS